jgi:hypothetical protein
MIAATAVAALLTALPATGRRWELLACGLAGAGGVSVVAALTDPVAVAALILLLGALHAALPARRPLVVRMRGPAAAALLLGGGWLLLHTGTAGAHRAGALAVGLAVAALAGLSPYLQHLDPDEPPAASGLAWTGFLAPALALVVLERVLPLAPAENGILSATLVGLGLLNLAWGTIGAWRSGRDADAWRASFLADWGLALVGLGLGVLGSGGSEARAAAFLVLISVLVVRLPLFVWWRLRPAREPGVRASGPAALTIVLGLALSGAAPFAGFPVRLLLLQAATREAWQLAAALLVAMAVWLLHAFRLARSLGRPAGGPALGLALVLAISLALGVLPSLLILVGRP